MKDKSVMDKALDELFKRHNLSLKTALQVIKEKSFQSVLYKDNTVYWYTICAITWAFDKGGYTLVRKKELEELREIRDKYRSSNIFKS